MLNDIYFFQFTWFITSYLFNFYCNDGYNHIFNAKLRYICVKNVIQDSVHNINVVIKMK